MIISAIHFKYLGSIIVEQGSKKEIIVRTAQANQVCSNLKVIWNDKHIRLGYKLMLINSLVIFLHRILAKYGH